MYKLKIKIINGSLNILTGIIVLVSLFPLYWLINVYEKQGGSVCHASQMALHAGFYELQRTA